MLFLLIADTLRSSEKFYYLKNSVGDNEIYLALANQKYFLSNPISTGHAVCRSGHENVVDMMLQRGAPISAKTKNGLAPLHMASQVSYYSMMLQQCLRLLQYFAFSWPREQTLLSAPIILLQYKADSRPVLKPRKGQPLSNVILSFPLSFKICKLQYELAVFISLHFYFWLSGLRFPPLPLP